MDLEMLRKYEGIYTGIYDDEEGEVKDKVKLSVCGCSLVGSSDTANGKSFILSSLVVLEDLLILAYKGGKGTGIAIFTGISEDELSGIYMVQGQEDNLNSCGNYKLTKVK